MTRYSKAGDRFISISTTLWHSGSLAGAAARATTGPGGRKAGARGCAGQAPEISFCTLGSSLVTVSHRGSKSTNGSPAKVFAGSVFLLHNETEREVRRVLCDAYTAEAARNFKCSVRNSLHKLEGWPEENRIQPERIKEEKANQPRRAEEV